MQIEALRKENTKAFKPENRQPGSNKKLHGPKWKFDRSASTTNVLTKNGKNYKWCTGPGHNKRPMWVVHEPGQCTAQSGKNTNSKPNLNNNPAYDRQALTSILKKRGNLTNDEVDSKVEAILAVMES